MTEDTKQSSSGELESTATADVPGEESLDFHSDPDALDEALEGLESSEALEAIDWRVAECLLALRKQINAAAPNRSKLSDGTIGDTNHLKKGFKNSDHNPHISEGPNKGVVTAMDITHDAAGGCDAGKLAESLVANRDPRVKYVIWNRRIANSSPIGSAAAWAWRTYTGSNPHNKHVHISAKADKALFDSAAAWTFSVK